MDETSVDDARVRFHMLGAVNTFGKTEAERAQLDLEYEKAREHYYNCQRAEREALTAIRKASSPTPPDKQEE